MELAARMAIAMASLAFTFMLLSILICLKGLTSLCYRICALPLEGWGRGWPSPNDRHYSDLMNKSISIMRIFQTFISLTKFKTRKN